MAADDAEAIARFQDVAPGAPAVHRTVDGRVLDDDGLRVSAWVDLLAPSDALDPAAVGTLLARLHTAPAPPVGRLEDHYTRPVPAADWTTLVADLRAGDAPFADALDEHLPSLADAASLVRPPATTCTCHRDLFADNLRADADGRLWVIDLDNAGPAEPSHELGFVLWEFARSSPERAAALHEAYARNGGPGRLTDLTSFSMIVSVASRLLYRSARLWLEQPDRRAFRRADVELWLADPCGRDVLDRMLAAVTA